MVAVSQDLVHLLGASLVNQIVKIFDLKCREVALLDVHDLECALLDGKHVAFDAFGDRA